MKKILSINLGNKGFRQEYDQACKDFNIDSQAIRSKDCVFILNNGTVSLFNKGALVTPEEFSYVYVRVAGSFSLTTSLVVQLFNYHNITISDRSYLQHTKNEEKITQMLLFTLAGIPIPKTVLFTIDGFSGNEETILKTVSFPCVLKTNGSQGRNVWKIENREELVTKVAALEPTHEVAMIQEFVPNTYDIRALYIHGDIIGAIKRSSDSGFLNNVSAGGNAEQITLEPHEIDLAIRATEVVGHTFAGVDIVRTPDGPRIFEVNLGPQIYGFERATGMDVPRELLQRINRDFLS